MSDTPITVITTDTERIMDYIDRALVSFEDKIVRGLDAMRVEINSDTYNIVGNIVDYTNNLINSMFAEVYNLQGAVADGSNSVEIELSNTENRLTDGQYNIIYTIENQGAELSDAIADINRDMTGAFTDVEDNLTLEISDATISINSNIDEAKDELISYNDDQTYTLSRSVQVASDILQNQADELSTITLGNIQYVEDSLTETVNGVATEIGEGIIDIQSGLQEIPETWLAGLQLLWERIESFVLEHFDFSLENLTELYIKQYTAQEIANKQLEDQMD